LNLAPMVRGETLSPETFAHLTHLLAPNHPKTTLPPDPPSHPQPDPSHA
jgi:hypothetical protein